MTKFGNRVSVFAIGLTVALTVVFAGCDSSPPSRNLETLLTPDAWLMDEQSQANDTYFGLDRENNTLRVFEDGTLEIWGARGLYELWQWSEVDADTLKIEQGRMVYADDGGEGYLHYQADSSTLTVSFEATDGSWESEDFTYTPGTLTQPLVYEEDYEDGAARFHDSTEWEIVDDGGNKVLAPDNNTDGNSDTLVRIIPGADFVMKMRFKLVEDATVDDNPHIWVGFHQNVTDVSAGETREPVLTLWDMSTLSIDLDHSVSSSDIQRAIPLLSWGTWHDLEIRAKDGTEYQIIIDGESIDTVEIEPGFVEGIKFEGNPTDEIWYIDDLRVEYPKSEAFAADAIPAQAILFHEDLSGADILAIGEDGTGLHTVLDVDGVAWKVDQVPGTNEFLFSQEIDSNPDVYLLDAEGTVSRLTTNVNRDSSGVATPDGTQIVFQSDRDGTSQYNHDVFIMDFDGSNQVNLTNTPDDSEYYAEVSPDGTKIAYVSEVPAGSEANVWVMDLDGTNRVQLTDDAWHATTTARVRRLSWNPDGSDIVFSYDSDENYENGGMGIYRVPSDSTNAPHTPTLVAPASAPGTDRFYVDPSYSPDGAKIAFREENKLLLMNADGSGITTLRETAGSLVWNPSWYVAP
ncbi:MAG: DPP IV N-terminal domain-containing protein [Spirochaetota bacterium]